LQDIREQHPTPHTVTADREDERALQRDFTITSAETNTQAKVAGSSPPRLPNMMKRIGPARMQSQARHSGFGRWN